MGEPSGPLRHGRDPAVTAVYHVTDGMTGGNPYAGDGGIDRWDITAACAIANGKNTPGEYMRWFVKEVADPRVQWLNRN